MSIYAIGDLHLSFKEEKPMNIFGNNWSEHEKRIEENWNKIVKEDDLVIMPGDFSWATYLEDTLLDFQFLERLPGKKILLKGNHDYWWTTIKSMHDFLNRNDIKTVSFLLNNSYEYENVVFVGTRGWALTASDNSEKMLKREANRLMLSINDSKQKYENKETICVMHYPPINSQLVEKNETNEYIDIMINNGIKKCLYGHLHGDSHKDAFEGIYKGIEFKLVSSDYLDFVPYKLK